ncbi:molybdopterin oxidoreductase [Pseudodesulfovibrio mercurii]|uniref:Molybdopterin oxidoreductase n=1 Tax=Pseudodesulfovibrio mercurii TaxID=641491 RepID=F0JF85_9BACT|nr:molybdopterin-dependent oxidoreductase [Pseudodesulfovibrio mercurii]EGB13641.1 molybdopterin oxidoreductase [Pseudodesulfovibrio mercurii]
MVQDGWHPTVCYQCKAECAILAKIRDGRVTEVKGNPKFGGKACVKGMAGVTLQYAKDRLTMPLKRVGERGEGKFEEISWDEAFDIMEAKLRSLYDRGEAHKLTYSFFPHSLTDPKWHFLNAYGGYINTGLPHCDSGKIVSEIKCWGGIPNHHIPPAWFTMPKDGIILLVGRHAFGCLDDACVPRDIMEAMDRGAKLVVVDPIFSPDAAKADWWIPIRPSGDTALFLGMINHIIENDLYDRKFVEEWVREGDFEKVKAHVKDMTPEAMSKICDVPAEDIRRLATMCAQAPAVGVDGFKSIMLGQALDFGHAWSIFLAITGNLDNPGGQPIPQLTPMSPVEPLPPGPAPLQEKGFHRTGPNSEAFRNYSFILEPTWYEAQAIKDGSLKILLVTEANPALTEMGNREWQKAVCMKDENGEYLLEFLLNTDIMLSETSKYADLVLPDQTHFERYELLYMPWWYNFGHGVLLRQPLVEAPGEAMHSNLVFIELGRRLFPEYFQFKDDVEYYDIQLKGLGLSVDKLKAMGGRWSPGTIGFRKYENGGFNTPSGKVQLYWDDLEERGQQLPRPILAPEYDAHEKDYPFIMISYRRIHINGTGPWSCNNAQLRDPMSGQETNPAILNPAAAARLGIKDGDVVTIASETGELTMPVMLTEHIRPDCVGVMHGFGATVGRVAAGCGYCDNELIPDAGSHLEWQDLVGGEAHVSTRVRISK